MTKTQRDELMRAYKAAEQALIDAYNALEEDDDLDDPLEPYKRERRRLQQAYWDGLPRMPLSACPFCAEILRRAFDPWGIDGYFWQEDMHLEGVDPPACPHFAVLVGAVNLNGLPPQGGPDTAYLGPEVPFVIPRVLSLPGMIAVVSTVPLENGYTTFPIAYFTDVTPDPFDLTHPWTRTTLGGRRNGEPFWTIKNDPWDFELDAWVQSGKLRWIAPGDPAFRVMSAPSPCPYIGLSGLRKPIVIEEGNTMRALTPPDGRPVGDPFE